MNRRALLSAAGLWAATHCLRGAPAGLAERDLFGPWPSILARMPPALRGLIALPQHEIQLIYTQVIRAADGAVRLHDWPLGLAAMRWFSAASLVKLPAALMAVERAVQAGLGLDAQIALDAAPASGTWSADEPLVEPLRRTLGRVFTVSDNAEFNRLYEFLGQDEIHARLRELGCGDARVIARIGSPDPQRNRRVGASRLLDASGRTRRRLPARQAQRARRFPYGRVLRGIGWIEQGQLIAGPHDFSYTNFIPLADMHRMLIALCLPQAVEPAQRWRIPHAMRLEVLEQMGRWPRESSDPAWPEAEYPDGFAKFLLLGDSKQRAADGLRMYGKSGQAYGYLSDCEYVRDAASGAEFFLSAVIHVNANGIYNDDIYEYDTLGFPFLGALGRAAREWTVEQGRAG